MTDYHDMLTSFMKAKDPTSGKPLDQDRVMLCSMAVLVAGSDTTSSTMRALLMYTMTTAGVMDKLLAEVSMQRGLEWRATSFAHKFDHAHRSTRLSTMEVSLGLPRTPKPPSSSISRLVSRKPSGCGLPSLGS